MPLRMNASISKTAASQITKNLESKLKAANHQILTKTALYMEQNIKTDPSVFVQAGKRVLADMQSLYYGAGGPGEEDVADFSNIDMIDKEIRTNVSSTITVIPQKRIIKWHATIVSASFMGLDGGIDGDKSSPGKPGTLPWIAFFVAGTIEDRLLWINEETSSEIAKVAKGWDENAVATYGRFKNGFLIPEYKIGGLLKSIGINPSNLVHPISGKSGADWFSYDTLTNLIQNNPRFATLYVEPAKAKAIQEVLSQINSETPIK